MKTYQVRHRRHPWRWAGGAVVVLLTLAVIQSMTTNPNYQWDVVGHYLFNQAILDGIVRTIQLTIISMVVGTLLGTLLAVMRLSPNPVMSVTIGTYVWIFRATPLLVQLLFWYNLGALYPEISLGVPNAFTLFSVPANELINAWTAALLGLALHQAAYTAEIVRAGILSVDPGQREAATALGMSPLLTIQRIVLPQAMRAIVPPMGNEVIGMMKTTSLVSIIALPELLNTAQTIYSRTYQTIPLLIVATIWYIVMTGVLTVLQGVLERRFGRGTAKPQESGITRFLTSRRKPAKAQTPDAFAAPQSGEGSPKPSIGMPL